MNPDAPTIEELLDYTDAPLRNKTARQWFADETRARAEIRVAKERAPYEYHGATLEVGHMYHLQLRRTGKRNMVYLGLFERRYSREAPQFVRVSDDGELNQYSRTYAPWSQDVTKVTEVEPNIAQAVAISIYLEKRGIER
jgi:hypothetical protein